MHGGTALFQQARPNGTAPECLPIQIEGKGLNQLHKRLLPDVSHVPTHGADRQECPNPSRSKRLAECLQRGRYAQMNG